ncbi:DUF2065 domain-containing protein [Legionella impletisoli]|uniref:DUF2065 domain-containing protein n=1 Tax=Legionella impletisoli TaxID=343510 RepID=A0A917JX47_9GAMM|nr:DUF2065 domain-containing protein [Legionella impletisoli]GGI86282.1 hypothetical protein GCM10007966_13610 [Legionella impletisoli]
MLTNFLSALALVLVFEGIMPFASPSTWKKLLIKVLTKDDRMLRISGFFSMMVGVILLTIIHQLAE